MSKPQNKLKQITTRSVMSGLKKVADYTKTKRVVFNRVLHGTEYDFNERKEFNIMQNKQLAKKTFLFGGKYRRVTPPVTRPLTMSEKRHMKGIV